ncbi:hypothetical protein JCM11251_007694 [Rhodosporidiobolus azoricus]
MLAHPDAQLPPEVQQLAPHLPSVLRECAGSVSKEDFRRQHFLLQGGPAMGAHVLHHLHGHSDVGLGTHNAVFVAFPLELAQHLEHPSDLSHERIWETRMLPNVLGWGMRRTSPSLELYTFSTTSLSRSIPQTRFFVRLSETLSLSTNPERVVLPAHFPRHYSTRVLSPTFLFVNLVRRIQQVFDSESRHPHFSVHRFAPYLLELHMFMCLVDEPALPDFRIEAEILETVNGAAYGYKSAAYWLLGEFEKVKDWLRVAAQLAWEDWGLKHAPNGVSKPANVEALVESMERSADEMKTHLLLLVDPRYRQALS